MLAFRILVLAGVTSATVKTWLANTNMENPNNWSPSRRPCSRDRLVFSPQASVSVYSTNITVQEIVLPNTGEIIFDKNTHVVIATSGWSPLSEINCNGNDLRFAGTEPKSWWNPNLWRVQPIWSVALPDIKSIDANGVTAVPDAERPPCDTDVAVFPDSASFNVLLDGPPISVQAFHVNGKMLTSLDWEQFRSSLTGSLQFSQLTSVQITGFSCTDVAGCKCGNTSPEVMSHICKHLNGHCPQQLCSDPISPVGSCCPICGSMMIITISGEFKMETFLSKANLLMGVKNYKNVGFYASLVSPQKIQAVAVDSVLHLNKDALESLKSLLDNGLVPGVLHVTLQSTVNWIPTHDAVTSRKGLTGGPLAALILTLLTAAILAVLAIIHYHNRWRFPRWVALKTRALPFVRFIDDESDTAEVEMAVEYTERREQLSETFDDQHLHGFGNPTYGTPPTKDPYADTPIHGGVTYENPTFKAYERIEDLDVLAIRNVPTEGTSGQNRK